MRVSVIIPTFNSLEYLKRVIDGFTVQSRPADEVLVADDGSGPETGQYVYKMAQKVPFQLIHVWHEDKGFRLAKIRNKAIKAATGDYVIMIDGDCIANRHFVEDHVRLAKPGFFVQGKRIIVRQQASETLTHKEVNSLWCQTVQCMRRGISNAHHLIRLPWLPPLKKTSLRGVKGCNMAFFREDLLAVNGYNESFIGWGREDSEIAVRLYRYGLRRREHPFMAICFHLWHPECTRMALPQNDRILEATIKGESYRCINGIEKI